MPLTKDFDGNPFRTNADVGRSSQLLLHCVLALSYKHMDRDTGSCGAEATMHKGKALQMLRDTESALEVPSIAATLLDAVLILMTLEVGPPQQFYTCLGTWLTQVVSAQPRLTVRGNGT